MSVLIEDPKTENLAREVSATTGETAAEAVNNALRERLERLRSAEHREFIARIREITDRVAEMPVLDARTPDEIIGYNEHGHFG
jgi:antitoxin VapB